MNAQNHPSHSSSSIRASIRPATARSPLSALVWGIALNVMVFGMMGLGRKPEHMATTNAGNRVLSLSPTIQPVPWEGATRIPMLRVRVLHGASNGAQGAVRIVTKAGAPLALWITLPR